MDIEILLDKFSKQRLLGKKTSAYENRYQNKN